MAEQDFLKLLDQDSRALRDQDELDQAFTYGSRFNPDQYAEALRTGQRTGLPAPTALERSGDLQPTLAAEDFRKRDLPRTAPSTASFLKQPDNAALALDDLDNLTGIEKSLAERNRDYNRETTLAERVGNRINEGWQGLKQSMVGMIYGESIRRGGDAGAGGDVQIGTDPLGMPIYTSQAYTPRQNQRVTQLQREVGVASNQALAEKSAPIQKARRAIEQRPATQAMIQAKSFSEGFDAFMVDPLGVLADIGISSSVQQLPALAATVATRSPAVAVAAAGGNSYALEYGGGVLQYLGEQGVDTTNADAIKTALADPNTARDAVRYAEARGAIVGGFDAASGGLLTKTLIPAKAIKNETARKAVNLLVAQPVAQGAVGAAGEATAQVATTGEVQAGEVLAEALGEFSTAPIEAVSLATDKIGQVQRAKDNRALFDSLSEGAANSRLRKRMPEKFRQWFEGVTKGGPLESIYMPADRFTTYFQAKGIDPMDVATRLGVTNFDEAVASGGDIEISTAAFAEQIAGTEDYAGLADDIRLDPDEMTNREALAFEEQLPALMAELRGLQDGEVDTSRNADDPSNAIYDDVLGQLMGTGMERSAAERNATIVQKTIGTIASRMGIDPMKLWGKYNLGIDRPLPAGMKRGTVDTQLDPYLDALRTGKVPGDNDIFGKSLVQALIEAGGLQPSGELDAMDAKLARPGLISQSGKSLDDALMWAYENGYIAAPTQALDRYDANAANTNDLLDLIDSELRGQRQYAMGRENTALMQFRDTVNQLGDWLRSMDIDLDGMDNEAIKALIRERAGAESAPADGMTTFDQEAGGTTPYTGDTIDIDGVQRSAVNSNGQRIAQTEEGLRNFWAWFGGSKVVDDQGRPLVVYHGTRPGNDIAVFRVRRNDGAYFTPDAGYANGYTSGLFNDSAAAGSVYPVYVSLQNPLIVRGAWESDEVQAFLDRGLSADELKVQGYDGAMLYIDGELDQLMAFEPTQIKSVNNRGTFDPSDPSILSQGIVKTDSAAFRAWFDGSKVVDKNGEPLVVYHSGSFDENDNPVPDIGANGFHFGTKAAAESRVVGKYLDDAVAGAEVYEEGGRFYLDENIYPDAFEDGYDTEDDARTWLQVQLQREELPELDAVFTEAYLSLKNPKRVPDQQNDWAAAIEQAKAEGHDGIVYLNEFEDKGSDSYIAFYPEQIKSVRNRGTFDAADQNILYQFAGQNAVTADIGQFQRAQQMEAKGASNDAILKETGWFKGVDGRWRFEISDDKAEFKDSAGQMDGVREDARANVTFETDNRGIIKASYKPDSQEYVGAFGWTEEAAFENLVKQLAKRSGAKGFNIASVKDGDTLVLSDVLEHPELFAAYPFLRSMAVSFTRGRDQGERGAFYQDMNLIEVNADRNADEVLSTLLHEIQHAIQAREDFARGGNMDSNFVNSVRQALQQLSDYEARRVERWKDDNQGLLDTAEKAAEVARNALKYESAERLLAYSERDKPSGVFRLIRNEMQWIYESEFRGNEAARDLQYAFYGMPKRGDKRNKHISDMAFKAAKLIRESIPADQLALFKGDQRTTKGMIAALQRESNKARKALQPLRNQQARAAVAESLAKEARYKAPFDVYRALAGEIEARTTQARQGLTAEERRQRPARLDMDVSPAEAIVIVGGRELLVPLNTMDKGVVLNQPAYHGSPYRFDKFTLDAIGTGEGAQAYGWGLYFAGKREIADFYRETLTNRDMQGYANAHLNARNMVERMKGDAEWAAEVVSDQIGNTEQSDPNYKRLVDTLEMITSGRYAKPLENTGQLYRVEIPEDDQFLLWDKPLSEQPEQVREVLGEVLGAVSPLLLEGTFPEYQKLALAIKDSDITGGDFYRRIQELVGSDRVASKILNKKLKIAGIKYLDGTSRSAGDGSFNYVVFDDQAVQIEQTFYQSAAEPRDLVITHNLTAENLAHAAKMGGLPVPSLAVTKKDTPLTGFGEITLMGSPAMADPKGYASTKVFGADIYSPRYPGVERDIDLKGEKQLLAKFKDMSTKLKVYMPDLQSLQRDGQRELERNVAVMATFLKEQGIEPEVVDTKVMDEGRRARLEKFGLGPFMDSTDTFDLINNADFVEAAANELIDMYREIGEDRRGGLINKLETDEQARRNMARDTANEIVRAARQRKNPEIDQYRTRDAMAAQIEQAGLANAFQLFIADELASVTKSERIFQGFTNAGNRKYIPHTLENVVKILKKDLRGGENFNYGVGSLRAKFTPQFKSVAEIRKNKDRLVSAEQFDAIKREIDDEFMAISDRLRNETNGSVRTETVVALLEDAPVKGLERAAKEYAIELTEDDKAAAVEFLNKLRNLPTAYFEAKILRDVSLSEFSGAVVPDNASEKTLQILRDAGIKDIRTYKAGDDAERAAQVASFETLLFQRKKDADAPRGQIAFGPDRQFRISLFAGADLSTFLHEGGHFYLEVMRDVVAELGAADPASLTETQRGLLDDGDRIIKWLGVESWDAIGVDQHEQFARGIEAYLMEGRAPSADLMPVFQRIKGWLIQIYRSLLALNVELTDDVRGVFDRLMATDAEIAAVRKAEAMSPLFSDADALRAAGATDAEIAAYQRTVQMDVAQAESEVTRKVMAHLKRQQQSWWREMRDTVRAEVVADLNNDPTYRAISTLSRGVLPDGSPLPDGFPAITLAKRPLLEKYGQAFLTERLLRLRVYRNEGGIDPDMAADMLGFGSGDELIEAIVNAPKYRDAVTAETDRRLEALYPDPMLDGSVSEMALLAAHNEKRAEIIEREITLLERQAGRNGQKVSRQVMKATAERVISEKRVRDIKAGSYKAAEAKASRAATRAFLKGDLATAAVEKRKQLLNHYLYRAATDALQAVEKQRDYLNKVAVGKSREAIVKGGREYIDRIDALLEAFDFGKVSLKSIDQQKVERARLLADMQAFAASKAEQGEVIEVDDQLLASPVANYKEMTPAQLQSLRDMVKNIATQARDAREFQAAEVKAAFDELATRTIGEIEDALPADRKGEVRGPVADKKRILSGYFLELRNLPSLIGELAGFKENSTLWNYIVRPLQQAAARENVMKQEANAKLRELFAPYKGENLYGKGETIQGALIIRPLNKMQRLMIAASWGAETGRQRLLDIGIDGKGFTQPEVNAILATLDERDWAFVKGLWSYLDSYWGDVSAKMERLGLEPERVQPLPIETRFGTMPGGYFPIKYEGRLDNSTAARDEAQIATEMKQAAFTRSTTRNGHTKARLDRVVEKGGVRYDFGVIFQHVNEVIHDLTHHEPLRDVQKLLNHKVADADGRKRSLLDVIVRKKGDLYRDQIRQVLDEIAVGDLRAPEGAEVILRHVASGSSIAIMGYSVWSAVQNVTGLLQSAQLLRGWLVKGLADWAGSPASMARQIDEVYGKSEFMRLRHVTLNRDIAALQNNLQRGVVAGELGQVIGGDIGGAVAAKSASGLDVFRDGAFWLMAKVQLLVDMPTWLGAYAKAQSENPGISEENAVALADQAVIDAQGGGRTVDLSKMLRGDGWKRVWTTFAQYFNVTYMRTVAAMKQFGMEPSPTAAARLTVDLMFLWFLPVVATMMMKSAVQAMVGGEGDDWDEFWEKLPKEQASYLVNFFPLLREAAALFSGYSGYSGPAGAKVFAEFNKLGQQAAQGEIDKALVKSATMTTGILFHIPTLQLIRTGEGMDAYLNGDGTPMAVVFGPPRN